MKYRNIYLILIACCVLFLAGTQNAKAAWDAPIGIPVPAFGVSETAGSVTSTALPATVSAGAVIQLSGTVSGSKNIACAGTAANPAFIRGAAGVTVTGGWTISGSYCIIENLKFTGAGGIAMYEGTHHIAIRNNEISGTLSGGGVGLGTWGGHSSTAVNNIVIDNNNFHDIGDPNAASDIDNHCVTLNGTDNTVWVTHNTFTRCGGDSMQVEAQAGRMASIHHVYFGKNVSSFNRQSGGWVKNATDVIFSQNVAHDFRDNSGGPGACYGLQYNNDYVWFLFNEGYACNIGIDIAGADNDLGQHTYIIGNIIHDTTSQGTNVYDDGAMVIRGSSKVYVINNTLNNIEAGLNMPPGSNTVTIYNNIFGTRVGSWGADLYIEGGLTLDVKNNLFAATPKTTGTTAGTAAITGNPKFVSTSDYHLQSASPAIDAGITSSAYATFQTRYGLDISKDFDGTGRPNSTWDIGAYEYTSGSGNPTPVVGDINQDHIVNSIDYSLLNAKWFTSDATCDLNHDGLVNAIDYSILNANWFNTW